MGFIGVTNFKFDNAGTNVSLKERKVQLKEEEYIFKTVICN